VLFRSPEAGRSAIVGSGIHNVDLVRHMVGKRVKRVAAFSNNLGTLVFPKDKTIAAIFQFEGNILGEVSVTYEAHRRSLHEGENIFYVVGTKGTASRDRIICDEWETWEALPQDADPISAGVFRLVDSFVDTLAHGAPLLVTAREAYESLAICVAADEAARLGEITVPEDPDF